MSKLVVTIEADGSKRRFVGEGSGAHVVAAFRVWLADVSLPIAEGADSLDMTAALIDRPAAIGEQRIRRGVEQVDVRAITDAQVLAPGLRVGHPFGCRCTVCTLDRNDRSRHET